MSDPIKMNIFNNAGMVVIKFESPLPHNEVSIDSRTARQIAEEIAAQANSAQLTVYEEKTESKLAEQIRGKMITRLTHVIKNSQNKNKLPGYIAQEVVDIIFSEVFR